jgi:hypothetical protein
MLYLGSITRIPRSNFKLAKTYLATDVSIDHRTSRYNVARDIDSIAK